MLALQHLGAAPIQPDPCRDNSGHKPLAGQILPAEFSPWPDFCMSAHGKGAEQGNGDTGQEYVLFGGFSAGYSCPAEGPRSFPSPFPTYVLFKPHCSQPHSSWPVKTSLHSSLVELSQEKDLGRFGGDFGPNTTGHTNSLTLAFHGTGMVEIRFSFPSKLLSSPQHKLSGNLDFL